jgi:hypothetical protein
MQITQLLTHTGGSGLVFGPEHLFQLTVSRKNKNNLKLNCRSKVPGAFADNIAQAWCNHFCELTFVSFSFVGIGQASRFGESLVE